jgi:hypothetical protein
LAAESENLDRLLPFLRARFPDVQVVSTPGYPDTSGLILKNGRLYSWAHAVRNGRDVTLIAPITHDFLVGLIPGLGDVLVLSRSGSLRRLVSKWSQSGHCPRRLGLR